MQCPSPPHRGRSPRADYWRGAARWSFVLACGLLLILISAGSARASTMSPLVAAVDSIAAEQALGAAARDRRELGAVLVIGAEGGDPEARRIDPDRAQLRVGALGDVAGEKPEHDVVATLDRVEELGDAGQPTRRMRRVAQRKVQLADIAIEDAIHARVDDRAVVSLVGHQLADDLTVGLAVEAMVGRANAAEDLGQRGMQRATTGTVAPEQGAVDVEEDDRLHRHCRVDHVRVSRIPTMIATAPPTWMSVGCSPNAIQATTSATTGWRLPYIAVRVGPSTRTPRYQNR